MSNCLLKTAGIHMLLRTAGLLINTDPQLVSALESKLQPLLWGDGEKKQAFFPGN